MNVINTKIYLIPVQNKLENKWSNVTGSYKLHTHKYIYYNLDHYFSNLFRRGTVIGNEIFRGTLIGAKDFAAQVALKIFYY